MAMPAERKPYACACGTPKEYCSGGVTTVNAGMRGGNVMKAHLDPTQAFKCHAKYLVKVGYIQLSPREFRAPDGSGIKVLTKQSRFGAKLRNGKEGTRNMPHVRGHRAGARGGVIISK